MFNKLLETNEKKPQETLKKNRQNSRQNFSKQELWIANTYGH